MADGAQVKTRTHRNGVVKEPKEKRIKQKLSWSLIWKQRYLIFMSLPFVVWVILFKYVPLWGWTMAFQDVKPATFATPIWDREFVGFQNFLKAFGDYQFKQTMINTIAISIIQLVVGTVASVFFALLLNEICFSKFKKVTQTISYLPHFVSWVIIASIAKNLFNDGGVFDAMFGRNLHLMSSNTAENWFIVVLIETWKECGWNAIVYLSAMAGIDTGLYEAAEMDGANRAQKMWHITLPGIKSTIIVLLIMNIGQMLNVGMERQMLLSNPLVQEHAMVLSWFSFERGIGNKDYGLGTAIGMLQSVVGMTLLLIANWIAGKVGDDTLL